jgi:MerR family copper efflux transcriptional regulator
MKSSQTSGATLSATSWSIGEIAERFALATHVLRHWEDVGLLYPGRDGGGRRRFSNADVVRVAAITRSKAAGMSLGQIRALLDGQANDRRDVLTTHIQDIDHR